MNNRLAAILADHMDRYPHKLEARFPHVVERLAKLWGTSELRPFMDTLLIADRPGRQGFPPDVATEIFRLEVLLGESGQQQMSSTGWNLALDNEFTRPKDR